MLRKEVLLPKNRKNKQENGIISTQNTNSFHVKSGQGRWV